MNIYALTSLVDRKSFFESLHEFFIPASALVIAGDFNCYENGLDKFGGNVSISNDCSLLRSDFALVDAWRKLHPTTREFTWFSSDCSIASHLDKFLVSKDLFSPNCLCEITPCPRSDHDFVSFLFEIPDAIKLGPGVWKFNNSLLDDKQFCDIIRSHVDFLSAFQTIQEESVSFARKKRRQLSRDRVFFTNKLISLRRRLVEGDNSVIEAIQDTETRLKAISIKEIEGIMIRSRAKWLEVGECPSRYFFQLQTSRLHKR